MLGRRHPAPDECRQALVRERGQDIFRVIEMQDHAILRSKHAANDGQHELG